MPPWNARGRTEGGRQQAYLASACKGFGNEIQERHREANRHVLVKHFNLGMLSATT